MEDNIKQQAINESLLEKARYYQMMYEEVSRRLEEIIKQNKLKDVYGKE